MSITGAALINETQALLQGFSLDEAQSTTLGAGISATDTSFTVTATRGVATGVSPGVIEIDQELIYCDSVDSAGNATIPPWGRGYQGTVPAVHNAGARVISQPGFPRFYTLRAINQTIERVFPTVFAVKVIETTTTFPVITYPLPNDAQWLLNAAWQVPDASQYWQSVRRWRMTPGGGTLLGDTSKAVDIGDGIVPGRPLQIIYAAKPAPLVSETDDFTTTTGLPQSLSDVIELGAASGMLTISQELSRLQMSSVEQQNRASLVAPSAALTSSRYLDQRFQARLAEEQQSLRKLYPPRISGVWT